MKIKLNLNVFLFFLLFLITNQLEIYILVMIFALIHEFAHMICGMILGFKPSILRILPFGFAIEFNAVIEDYNNKILKSNIIAVKNIIIAMSGPLINLIIVIFGTIYNIETNIVYSNFLIFIVNLIPIYPLDGGRILKNLLKIFCGNRKANIYINSISYISMILLTMLSSIMLLIFKNVAILIIIIDLWYITIKENRNYLTYNKVLKIIDKTYN